jgi:sugar lactone lactonase YvrE
MTPRSRRCVPGRRAVAALLAPMLFAACATAPPSASPPRSASPPPPLLGLAKVSELVNGYASGNRAFADRNWVAAAEGFARAYAFNPADDLAAYLTAAAWARAGKPDAALEWLQRLVRSGSCLQPSVRSFAAIAGDARLRDVEAALPVPATARHRASPAFTVAEKDLVPEAIAWDPVEKVFYLSSRWKRKIVRVKPGAVGGPAAVEDFVPEGADELDAVVAVKVDAKRRRLWAASAAGPEMKGFAASDDGRSALFEYDLSSKRLLRTIWMPRRSPHYLSDLALDTAGNVYAADTVSTEILVLRAGSSELETLVPQDRFVAPNGIVASEDGSHLWVSDVVRGTFHVDTGTGKVVPLDQPAGLFPVALTGLVLHDGALVGIQGAVSVGRVARWRLGADGISLGPGELLECAHPSFHLPTRGAVVDGALFFVANGQSDAIEDGTLSAGALEEIVILKLPL